MADLRLCSFAGRGVVDCSVICRSLGKAREFHERALEMRHSRQDTG